MLLLGKKNGDENKLFCLVNRPIHLVDIPQVLKKHLTKKQLFESTF